MTHAAGIAYSTSGDHYLNYADGDPERLFNFTSHFAYADAQLWAVIARRLRFLRADGREELRVLDAGCGPGTWLRRIITEAHRLGFKRILATGFDIAETQIVQARNLTRDVRHLPGVSLSLELRDLTEPLIEADQSIDLTLCLYCVLNHLPQTALPAVTSELARVTRGVFITTVRTIGSVPTAFVDSLDHTRMFRQDNALDRFEVELLDGQQLSFPSHLFCAKEFRTLMEGRFAIDALRGLDLFHSRFSPDPRWNPGELPGDEALVKVLARLEDRFATHPAFIDRATHILLIGRPKPV
jgi:SAM-dependent methyltransferase